MEWNRTEQNRTKLIRKYQRDHQLKEPIIVWEQCILLWSLVLKKKEKKVSHPAHSSFTM